MNAKQILILVGILVLCGGGALIVNSRRSDSVEDSPKSLGKRIFPDFPLNDINRIVIRGSKESLTLSKADGKWKVDERAGYPADFTKIKNFLTGLWGVEIADVRTVGASKLGVLELKEPVAGGDADGTGTVIELEKEGGVSAGKCILGKTFSTGEQQPSPFGFSIGNNDARYVKTPDSGSDVWLVSEAFSQAVPTAGQWLDKTFFNVEKLAAIEYKGSEEGAAWKFTRTEENGDLVLDGIAAGEGLDTGAVSPIKNAFSSLSFKDVSPGAKPEETGLGKADQFLIKTFDGFDYHISLGKAGGEGDVYLTMKVKGTFPTEFTPSGKSDDTEIEGETEEDKKKRMQEELELEKKNFEAEIERRQKKLEKEKTLENKVFVLDNWTVESLIKTRADFIEKPEPEGSATVPGKAPFSATTPPIEIPVQEGVGQ